MDSKCLVINVPGTCTDTTLRKLGELRFTAYADGNKSGLARLTLVRTTTGSVKIRIVKGLGSLYATQGGTAVQELVLSNTTPVSTGLMAEAYLSATTDCVLGIEGAANIIEMGSADNGKVFFTRLSTTNSPYIGLDVKELINLTNCINMSICASVRAKYTGDISIFGRLPKVARIYMSTSDAYPSELTGDISVFTGRTNLAVLDFDYSSVYGNISAFSTSASLQALICRGTDIYGNINSLPANMSSLFHSNISSHAKDGITFDMSSSLKPSSLHIYDSVGGGITGTFDGVIKPTGTLPINVYVGSVSGIDINLYDVVRAIGNRELASITTAFGSGSTFLFSGNIGALANTGGIGIVNFSHANIPAANAVEILEWIYRSTARAGTKSIQLRTDATNAGVIASVARCQSKGYSVLILPLL